MKKIKLVVLIILAISLFLSSFILFNKEVRDFVLYKTFPGYAKNVGFLKLEENDKEIYLLGTIHGDHLKKEGYSLLHIEAVIANLKPDLLLVESRPGELERDNIGDGPIEMSFANLKARAMGLKVEGMDWFILDGSLTRSNDQREDKMFENAQKAIENSKKILVLMGFSHVPEFEKRFKEAGFNRSVFTSKDKRDLFDSGGKRLIFPTQMSIYTQKRIDIEKENLADESNKKVKDQLAGLIKSREAMLDIIKEIGEE